MIHDYTTGLPAIRESSKKEVKTLAGMPFKNITRQTDKAWLLQMQNDEYMWFNKKSCKINAYTVLMPLSLYNKIKQEVK